MFKMNTLILIIAVYSSIQLVKTQSHLDLNEIYNYKYNFDILKDPVLQSDSVSEETLVLKNVHGQKYECNLPNIKVVEKSIETDSSNQDDKDKNISKYNFTSISEKVNKSTYLLSRSNMCVFRSLGWWTYELCFGSHVSQYHMLSNGTIEGAIINLGNFSSDFDWLLVNDSTLPLSSGILYHEQYYTNGSICELNQKPRRVVAKLFCDEEITNEIILVSEVETCVYEIQLGSRTMCNVPGFSKEASRYDLVCKPVVDSDVFNKYLEKKTEKKSAAAQVIGILDKNQDDLEELNSKLLKQNLQVLSTLESEGRVDSQEVDELKEWLINVEKELAELSAENREQTDYFEKVNEIFLKSDKEISGRKNKNKLEIKVIKMEGGVGENGEYDSILSMLMKESEVSKKFKKLYQSYNIIYGFDGAVQVETEVDDEPRDGGNDLILV